MFGGNQQGGGGSNLVRLTAMFPSKKGNGTYVGSIKPQAFNVIFKMMQEADSKGVDLMFIASPDRQDNNRVVLYVAPSNRASGGGVQQAGPFGSQPASFGGGGQNFAPAPPQASSGPAPTAAPFGAQGGGVSNPPKDEIDALLESL